jgi:hypothetical protein
MLRYRLRLLTALAAVAFGAACADAPTAPPAQPPAAPESPSSLLGLNIGLNLGGPTLLQCPNYTTTSTTGLIGPLGGVLSLGEYVVSIPEGALLSTTLFQLTIPASRYMKVDVTAVGLEHFLFQKPISVTVDYSRCSLSATTGKDLEVWYVSPLLNIPLQNMGGVNDAASRKITFQTDHLSGYVIAY